MPRRQVPPRSLIQTKAPWAAHLRSPRYFPSALPQSPSVCVWHRPPSTPQNLRSWHPARSRQKQFFPQPPARLSINRPLQQAESDLVPTDALLRFCLGLIHRIISAPVLPIRGPGLVPSASLYYTANHTFPPSPRLDLALILGRLAATVPPRRISRSPDFFYIAGDQKTSCVTGTRKAIGLVCRCDASLPAQSGSLRGDSHSATRRRTNTAPALPLNATRVCRHVGRRTGCRSGRQQCQRICECQRRSPGCHRYANLRCLGSQALPVCISPPPVRLR